MDNEAMLPLHLMSFLVTWIMRQSASSASAQVTPRWGQVLCMLEGGDPTERELGRWDKWATGTS